MMIPALLYVTHLSGGYRRGDAILDISHLPVFLGEALGIVGLNGSGKSTFGKALMNMLPYRDALLSLRERE